MIDNQLGRRNITAEQASYLRGKQYRGEKKPVGGNGSNQHKSNVEKVTTLQKDKPSPPPKPVERTAEKIAKKHNVTEKTIRNDATYADAVDTIERLKPDKPEIKQEILSRKPRFENSPPVRLMPFAASNLHVLYFLTLRSHFRAHILVDLLCVGLVES